MEAEEKKSMYIKLLALFFFSCISSYIFFKTSFYLACRKVWWGLYHIPCLVFKELFAPGHVVPSLLWEPLFFPPFYLCIVYNDACVCVFLHIPDWILQTHKKNCTCWVDSLSSKGNLILCVGLCHRLLVKKKKKIKIALITFLIIKKLKNYSHTHFNFFYRERENIFAWLYLGL